MNESTNQSKQQKRHQVKSEISVVLLILEGQMAVRPPVLKGSKISVLRLKTKVTQFNVGSICMLGANKC